ncbi:hypothetical protein BJ170DRAFT_590902 [Xylariales sp. AK1849]|nr:hypothetical protein BJ170DRAFT_590902 [Xylariales sp. AK1849]
MPRLAITKSITDPSTTVSISYTTADRRRSTIIIPLEVLAVIDQPSLLDSAGRISALNVDEVVGRDEEEDLIYTARLNPVVLDGYRSEDEIEPLNRLFDYQEETSDLPTRGNRNHGQDNVGNDNNAFRLKDKVIPDLSQPVIPNEASITKVEVEVGDSDNE